MARAVEVGIKNLPVRFYLNASLRCIILPLPRVWGIKLWCVSDVDCRLSLSAEYIGPRTEKPRKTKIGGIQR